MRIEWDPRALRDLEEMRAFTASDEPSAASRVAEQIKSSVRRLSEFPHLGRQTREVDIRILAIPGTPYVVYYHLLLDHIESSLFFMAPASDSLISVPSTTENGDVKLPRRDRGQDARANKSEEGSHGSGFMLAELHAMICSFV